MQFLCRDGVRLTYREAGSGSPPLLFIHGWSCDHSYFAPQFECFKARHRVVSVDLRGHGASDKPDGIEYTMALFADDLTWMCEQLGIEHPVVVGHSLGGVVAFEMTIRHPDLVGGVIAVDSPLLRSQEWNQGILAMAGKLNGPDYQSVAEQYVHSLFLATDDAGRKAGIVAGMSGAAQHVMVSALEGICACDTDAALSRWKGPALVIDAHPYAGTTRLFELCPQIMIGHTIGAGHFNQLEVPEQVNAMIERFIQISF